MVFMAQNLKLCHKQHRIASYAGRKHPFGVWRNSSEGAFSNSLEWNPWWLGYQIFFMVLWQISYRIILTIEKRETGAGVFASDKKRVKVSWLSRKPEASLGFSHQPRGWRQFVLLFSQNHGICQRTFFSYCSSGLFFYMKWLPANRW
jgi:hypothetical protein